MIPRKLVLETNEQDTRKVNETIGKKGKREKEKEKKGERKGTLYVNQAEYY